MKKQEEKDNFNKKANTFLYDNKSDEIVLNVLDLYPKKHSFFFKDRDGQIKKKKLAQNLRTKFDAGYDQYESALGDKIRSKAAKIRENLSNIGDAVKTASLAPARASALALIRVNFRGLAKRFSLLNDQGKEKLGKKWDKLGGSKSKLFDAIDAGKSKPIIVCGKKCRAKAGSNPQLPSSATQEFVNVAGVDDAGIGALIAAGGSVIAALLKIVGNNKDYKNQAELAKLQSDLDQKEKQEAAIDATMTSSEAKIADEVIKAQQSGFDPVEAIKNNPNLTAEEKKAALKALGSDLSSGPSTTTYVFLGIGVIGLIGLSYYLMTKNNS